MIIPGMAARASLITLPQALRPVQTALKVRLAQQKGMGEASRCAAHKAPASQVPVATKTGRCAAHKAPARQVPVATKTGHNC